VVLFDHSPSYNAVTHAALLASSEMLIPCELSKFAVSGLMQLYVHLAEELDDHTLTLAGIVPFKVDRRLAVHTLYLKEIEERFAGHVLPVVRTDSTVARSQTLHETVYQYDPRSKAAEDFTKVASALMAQDLVAA